VGNCVPFGIEPHRLLNEKFTLYRDWDSNSESFGGISPLKLFLVKSNYSKVDMTGIFPSNWFQDKFNSIKNTKISIPSGISPIRLLLDKSNIMFLENTNGKEYSNPSMSTSIS
jgi:hypothetical protein